MTTPRNPFPTADAIIEMDDGAIVLIERKNVPHGWALPGGFIDYGESAEDAAVREAKEETGLDVRLIEQFHTYSAPDRDPRHHTITIVFIARAGGDAHLEAPDRLRHEQNGLRSTPAPTVLRGPTMPYRASFHRIRWRWSRALGRVTRRGEL